MAYTTDQLHDIQTLVKEARMLMQRVNVIEKMLRDKGVECCITQQNEFRATIRLWD